MDIGDKIYFKQKKLYVNQYEAKLHKGDLIYKYRFCRDRGIWQYKIYNQKIKGVSLEGKVLETAGEKIKIHLNIDESQDPSKAEWFYYTPPTGNILYSMPLVGENAMLYFQDEIDADPIVTNCVRKNGSTCASLANTDNRYFATESGNYLDMLPGAINFHRSGFNVNLNNQSGIIFSSSGDLRIGASGSVNLSAGSVSINATSKLLVQKSKGSYISLENEFYVQSSVVYESGSSRESYSPFTDDEPTAGVKEAIAKKIEDSIKFAVGLLASAMSGAGACIGSVIGGTSGDLGSTKIKSVRLGAKLKNSNESVYEIKADDDKSFLDDLSERLSSTKPPMPFRIPKCDDIIPKILGSAIGSLSGAISSIEKKAGGYINQFGTIELYPSCSDVKLKPYKKVSKIGTAATIFTSGLDIGNTWSEDNGNTIGKRIMKTGIQTTVVLVSYGVGTLTGEIAATGIAAAPESGGVSLIAVPAAATIDYEPSKKIDEVQDKLYETLKIK